jgi:head-tail adaptor
VDAGALRDVILLQRPVFVRETGFNTKQKTFVDVVRGGVRGRAKDVRSTSDTEQTKLGQRQNVRTREVEIRWVPNVSSDWRLRVNAETRTDEHGEERPLYFQIVSVAELPGHREGWALLCEEYRS